MPLLGAHMSIAGGLHKAVEAAAALGMETVQIFTHSPSQWAVKPVAPAEKGALRDGRSLTKNNNHWRAKPLSDEEITLFQTAIRETGIRLPCAHDSYLINLASPDDELWQKSLNAFTGELERAESLGLTGVVMHPGSFVDSTEEQGLARIITGLDEVHRRTAGFRVQTWLEVTAGQGTNLGYRFEHLATILQRATHSERFGICIDTCHLFAAGYGLRTEAEYRSTFEEFDDKIGMKWIRAFHLNDSKKGQGSRVDRHEHIGEGCLGLEPFRFVLNDPRFAALPMYLETKKEKRDGEEMDAANLRVLKSLIAPASGESRRTRRPRAE